MKAALLALLLITSALAHSSSTFSSSSSSSSSNIGDEEFQSLWASWKIQYNKDYSDEETEALRFNIFIDNYNAIQAWNSEENTAILAVNKFADLNNAEFASLYANAYAAPDSVAQENLVTFGDVDDIPSSWDWVSQGAVTAIKNQAQCGSCWAFATVATTEGLYFINGNTLTSFSEQQIVDCDTTCDGCGGGWPYLAMAYVAKNGLETEQDYPYAGVDQSCAFQTSNAVQTGVTGAAFVTPKNVADLQAAIVQQPVAVIVEADQNAFQFYSSGVITTGCGVALDHAITAVGYGNSQGQVAFTVKNSWGTDWGVEGYVYISTSTQYNDGLGACGILSQPQFPKGLKN